MKKSILVMLTLGLLLCSSALLLAASSGKALWIELKEKGDKKTLIAVTEPVARMALKDSNKDLHFTNHMKNDLITKEMVLAVLDGKEESLKVQDPEDGSEITMYMDDLDIPHEMKGDHRILVETYKHGKRTFRMSLGDIDIDQSDDNGEAALNIGWKGLLPFLGKEGGAVYIKNDKEDTEVWIVAQ
jgi:hypothetical protein